MVLVLGIAAIVMGGVFVAEGKMKADFMSEAMRQEQISLGTGESEMMIDSAEGAQAAADIIREHRRDIAPTYGDLLGTGRFDPTDSTQLTYAQAMNLENYLYLAVVGFGLTTVVMVSGAFMIVTGLALSGTGAALIALSKRQ